MNLRPYLLPGGLFLALLGLVFVLPPVDARDWSAILPATAVAVLVLLLLHRLGTPPPGLAMVFPGLIYVVSDVAQLIVDGRFGP